MVQATFTRQKRELAKAAAWMEKLRAQEVRQITYNANLEKVEETRDSYVDFSAEAIAAKVLTVVVEVVGQHGSRQRANSRNTGRLSWQGITADLTVPQLRTLQEAQAVLSQLVHKLPRRNPRLLPNMTVDGRPAFGHKIHEHRVTKTRYVPFEEESTTRVRTYEERYEEITHVTQTVEIDYGLDARQLELLQEIVADLSTAIQVAIDEANGKGHDADPVLNDVIARITGLIAAQMPPPVPPQTT